MTVTAVPNRPKMEANSMPTAPAPMTMRLLGISFNSRISSEVMMRLPSMGMFGRVRGLLPVASMMFFVGIREAPPSEVTRTLLGFSIRPWPLTKVILFFLKRYPSMPFERRFTIRFLRAMRAEKSMPTFSARMPNSFPFLRSSYRSAV